MQPRRHSRTLESSICFCLLLVAGCASAPSKSNPLSIAIQQRDTPSAIALIKQTPAGASEKQLAGPLELAISNTNLAVVKALIEQGANPNTKVGAQTVLHLAAKRRAFEILEYLVSKGGDLNAKTGWTAYGGGDVSLLAFSVYDCPFPGPVTSYLIEKGVTSEVHDNVIKQGLVHVRASVTWAIADFEEAKGNRATAAQHYHTAAEEFEAASKRLRRDAKWYDAVEWAAPIAQGLNDGIRQFGGPGTVTLADVVTASIGRPPEADLSDPQLTLAGLEAQLFTGNMKAATRAQAYRSLAEVMESYSSFCKAKVSRLAESAR